MLQGFAILGLDIMQRPILDDALGSIIQWKREGNEPPHGATSTPVSALVQGDGRKPPAHRLVGIVAPQGAMSGNECFLHQVQGFVGIADTGRDDPKDWFTVATQDLGERRCSPRNA